MKCWVCKRQARGYGHTDNRRGIGNPGRYPIDWVYQRRDLPVQIEREFEVWRLISDQDGIRGWVHQATLTGRRGFVVISWPRRPRWLYPIMASVASTAQMPTPPWVPLPLPMRTDIAPIPRTRSTRSDG